MGRTKKERGQGREVNSMKEAGMGQEVHGSYKKEWQWRIREGMGRGGIERQLQRHGKF